MSNLILFPLVSLHLVFFQLPASLNIAVIVTLKPNHHGSDTDKKSLCSVSASLIIKLKHYCRNIFFHNSRKKLANSYSVWYTALLI